MKKSGRPQLTSCRSATSQSDLQLIRTPARTAKTSASRRKTLDARPSKRPNELPVSTCGHKRPVTCTGTHGYKILSGGQQFLISGDVVHVPEILVALPDTGTNFDVDHEQATSPAKECSTKSRPTGCSSRECICITQASTTWRARVTGICCTRKRGSTSCDLGSLPTRPRSMSRLPHVRDRLHESGRRFARLSVVL